MKRLSKDIVERIHNSMTCCPFRIGQKVHMLNESYEMEVVGVRRNPYSKYYEVEVMLSDIGVGRTWHLLPNVLTPADGVNYHHLYSIDGGKC